MARKVTVRRSEYDSPHDQYIHSPEPVSVKKLAKAWQGLGCSLSSITKRCTKERWKKQRKDFQREYLRRIEAEKVEDMYHQIIAANERHVRAGAELQEAGSKSIKRAMKDIRKVEPDKAARVGTQMVKVGVDVERKGLGLADAIVQVRSVQEMTAHVLNVVARYHGSVITPEVYASMRSDMVTLLKEDEDAVVRVAQGMLSSGDVNADVKVATDLLLEQEQEGTDHDE